MSRTDRDCAATRLRNATVRTRWRSNVISLRHSRFVAAAAGAVLLLTNGCGSDPGYDGKSSKYWIAQLKGDNTRGRIQAADALGKVLLINSGSHDAVDALSAALLDTSDQVRLAAATSLTSEGVSPFAALGGFHSLLHDSAHAQVRQTMASLVGALGPARGRGLIVSLVELLSDPDAGVRATAVQSLSRLGPATQNETNAIARLAQDPDPTVREAVVISLGILNAPVDVILRVSQAALNDSIATVQSAAAVSLSHLGRGAVASTADLIALLSDSDANVRASAALALEAIGPPASTAEPTLERLLADKDRRVASAASNALAAINGRPVKPKAYTEPSALERCPPGSRNPGC